VLLTDKNLTGASYKSGYVRPREDYNYGIDPIVVAPKHQQESRLIHVMNT
jgi:hypothetical protein